MKVHFHLLLYHFFPSGVLIAGFGNGIVRIYTLLSGGLIADVTAHAGWITGMDLANKTGRLLTAAEDGYVRVR